MSGKPKKGGRSKGQTLSLGEFHKDSEPVTQTNDWAEDVWDPEQDGDQEEGGEAGGKRKPYSRTANNRLADAQNFRDAPAERTDKMVDMDMKGPYVGHFGNLTNGITEDELRDEFNEDCVKQVKLVSNNGRTFANIEFTSVQALQIAMLSDGKTVKGRKIRACVATEVQIERLLQPRGGNLNRDTMGQATGSAAPMLSRDEFGNNQPQGDRQGMRTSASQNFDLSRDGMGSGQRSVQPPQEVDLGHWRDAPSEKQPVVPRSAGFGGFRDSRRSVDDLDQQEGNDQQQQRPQRRESPKPDGSAMANWRDQPREEQPTVAPPVTEPAVQPVAILQNKSQKENVEVKQPAAAAKDTTSPPKKSGGKPHQGSSENSRFAATNQNPPPATNSRFDVLRK